MGSGRQITREAVERLRPGETIWCVKPRGFGVRRQRRDAVYMIKARIQERQRFITIGVHGKPWTPETARKRAVELFGIIAAGGDPASERDAQKAAVTVEAFFERYLKEHAQPKKKPSSAAADERNFRRHIRPEIGHLKLRDVTRSDLVKLHSGMQSRPIAGNRCLALLSHMFSMAEIWGIVPETANPCRRIQRYREEARERFLTTDELQRLGDALREAETVGVPWDVDLHRPGAKHLAKEENRRTIIGPHAIAAIRLLLFTGARLREILGLRWEWIDLDRGVIFLPDSKTGKKSIVLGAPAISVPIIAISGGSAPARKNHRFALLPLSKVRAGLRTSANPPHPVRRHTHRSTAGPIVAVRHNVRVRRAAPTCMPQTCRCYGLAA
jgi:integrase